MAVPAVEESSTDALKQAWIGFLGRYEWAWFLTITFRTPRMPWHTQAVLRQIEGVVRRTTKGRLFLGAELHINRTLHVHGLLESRLPLVNPGFVEHAVWRDLFETFGRSQVRPPQDALAVETYVTKYCLKALHEYLVGW